jgi:hypothetical protein
MIILPFPNHCSTVVSQQYQVLCIMIDKLSSVVLANCWLLQYPWFCFGSPWSPASSSVPPLIAIFFQILSYFSFFHVTQGLFLIFSVPEGLPDSISVILKGYQSQWKPFRQHPEHASTWPSSVQRFTTRTALLFEPLTPQEKGGDPCGRVYKPQSSRW